jgi:hypothetical protein
MLFEEICNYCADIAIIAVLVTTFANTRKTKPKKKKVATKQPNKKHHKNKRRRAKMATTLIPSHSFLPKVRM